MGILYPSSGELSSENDHHAETALAKSNTITLLHNNAQPNLSLLKYFSYDPTSTSTSPNHPLSTNLHPLSWLQLISPSSDPTYSTPITPLSPTTLSALKSGKRGTYYRKLRRHNRITSIVTSTLAGSFSGLAIASHMDPISILRHTIPLLSGGAPIAIFSPTIEPLVILSDAYSTSRRTAFIQSPPSSFTSLPIEEQSRWQGDDDFPLNPTLVINTAVQSARVREWQVLPGRTHPVMTGRGGAEGYLFTAVRVIPAQGRVEARGKFVKKKEGGGKQPGKEGGGDMEESSPPKKVKLAGNIDAELEGGVESTSNLDANEDKEEMGVTGEDIHSKDA
jgi:tRNA (adenine-N(1)-)-methyltransferase non-catalytic subunit